MHFDGLNFIIAEVVHNEETTTQVEEEVGGRRTRSVGEQDIQVVQTCQTFGSACATSEQPLVGIARTFKDQADAQECPIIGYPNIRSRPLLRSGSRIGRVQSSAYK
jgi:hypothetical protein